MMAKGRLCQSGQAPLVVRHFCFLRKAALPSPVAQSLRPDPQRGLPSIAVDLPHPMQLVGAQASDSLKGVVGIGASA